MFNVLFTLTPLAPYQIFEIVFFVVLGIALIWLILCYVIANVILKMATKPTAHTFFEARETQSRVENIDFTDYDEKWRKQAFTVDGEHGKISGEIIFNDEAKTDKVAIICHGHTWNRLNSLKYGNIFYKAGYNLIIYDHAHFGESEGTFCTLGYYERHDLSKVIDYARSVFDKDAFIALHGESMGAVTVLSVLGLRNDVDLVVADCPFSDTMSYYREVFTHTFHLPSFPVVEMANLMAKHRYKYDFYKCVPIDDVKNSDTPICFIHGANDTFIYPHHSQDMYAVCANPLSELHLFEGAGHARSYLSDNSAYVKTVSDFISKVEQARNVRQLDKAV